MLTQARLTFSRQQELLKDGWTTRANFDEAQQKLLTAQAQVDSAEAQVRTAREQQSYTVLLADAPGAVTAVGAEPGEVVHAGQMVVQLAREGGRDAVFDVPEQLIRNGPRDPTVEIALSQRRDGEGDRPGARGFAPGRFRDPDVSGQGRHHRSAGGHAAGSHGHRPHQIVRASRRRGSRRARLPRRTDARPSGWSIRRARQCPCAAWRSLDTIRPPSVISKGLETGEFVVTAGVQTLRPGQKVRILGAAS